MKKASMLVIAIIVMLSGVLMPTTVAACATCAAHNPGKSKSMQNLKNSSDHKKGHEYKATDNHSDDADHAGDKGSGEKDDGAHKSEDAGHDKHSDSQ